MTGYRPEGRTGGRGFTELEYVDPRALEKRASLALKFLSALFGFGVVLSFVPQNPPVATLLTVAFNAASATLVVAMVAVALAVDRDRPWAIAAIRPLFTSILLGGLGLTAFSFSEGRFRPPFDVLVAAWVLLGRPHTRPMPRLERRSLGVAAVAAAALSMMVGAGRLFSWGGALDVQPTDLRTSISVRCSGSEPVAGVPRTIEITYDWSWATWRPFASGFDVAVIGWDGDDDRGRPLFFVGSFPDPGHGIYPGQRLYPSAEMAAAVLTETRGHWPYGIRLDERGYDPGRIVLPLVRASDLISGPEPLRISATYIHQGVWRKDEATVTCSW